ncbi:MAG: quinone oxidoreductase [Spongiibacteraceae bacterium]
MSIEAQAIRIRETGGPEKLLWENITVVAPAAGEVLVRNVAVGLNFVDTYFRSGLYPAPLPLTPGLEGAGVIEAVGPGINDFQIGDRVAYIDPLGAYAELLLRPVERLIKLPDSIGCELAAAMMLKGLTAQYLLRSTYRVNAGETILVHAAAGGVGQILCQWAQDLGATVIGTVGSDDKVAIAQAAGCDHVIVSAREQVSERVRALTDGRGVPVVYDGLGQATFVDSINCLQPRGLMVNYGNASGPVANFSLALLAKGSLYLTRPTLATYNQSRADLLRNAAELFDVVGRGAVRIAINGRYALRNAAQAHSDLEGRKTTGSNILLTGAVG